MSSRKIEKFCMELIKPISPTPNHLRCFQFSFLEQMTIPTSVPIALFYPPPFQCGGVQSYSYEEAKAVNSSRLLVLKKSLSELLARCYPFAGRVTDNSIECNDDGVPFYEAFAHKYRLEDVVGQPNVDIHFLPSVDDQEGSLIFPHATFPLLIQVTLFECGGIAIGVRANHKIADCSTVYTLVSAWAVTARGSHKSEDVPELVIAAKFLPQPIPHVFPNPSSIVELFTGLYDNQQTSKTFMFDVSTITSLKDKVVCDAISRPTRVEVVSAVLWKCFMAATANTTASSSSSSRYLLFNVNIRKRLVPALPNHSVGNVVATTIICKGKNDDSDLTTLVASIRKGLSEYSSKYADKSRQEETILSIPQEGIEVGSIFCQEKIHLLINSWCGYQFYEVDFGWGKPSWVSSIEQPYIRNYIRLMDSRDTGGIEALVCLTEKEMEAFEQKLIDMLAITSAK